MATGQSRLLLVMADANLLVVGTAWPRWPYEVLRHAIRGDYQLVLSAQIIAEARSALREIAPRRLPEFEEVLSLSDYIETPTPSEVDIEANRNLIRDPKDIHVALAAIRANLDCLITQDKDFMAQDETTHILLKQLNIMLPGTFLRQHMGWTSEQLEAIRYRTWGDLPSE